MHIVGICGKICDICIWPKYADPKSVRRIVAIGTVGIGTCTRDQQLCALYVNVVQEIRNSGAIGYKYITVDEDEAANVIYANNVLLHLANEQIPRGSAVSHALSQLKTFGTICLELTATNSSDQ